MIEHYIIQESSTSQWLDEMRKMEEEESWSSVRPYRRVVSLDFISGCADELKQEAA